MDPVDTASENFGEVLAAFGRGNDDVAGEIAWYVTLGRHLDDADPADWRLPSATGGRCC